MQEQHAPSIGSEGLPPRLALRGELLLLLAGLAALGSLATNIILPAFPAMGADLGTSVKGLSATLGSFFVAFATGQLFVGPRGARTLCDDAWLVS